MEYFLNLLRVLVDILRFEEHEELVDVHAPTPIFVDHVEDQLRRELQVGPLEVGAAADELVELDVAVAVDVDGLDDGVDVLVRDVELVHDHLELVLVQAAVVVAVILHEGRL